MLSVLKFGRTLLGFDNRSQLSTFDFQSQVCLSISKARPAGQRTAAKRIVPARPARSHLTTSRQSPSVVSLKYSSDTRSLQSSSGERFNNSSSSSCLLYLSKCFGWV